MQNPFTAFIGSILHLAAQARRLGDAFGSLAEQVEQRQALPASEATPSLPEPRRNGRVRIEA